MRCSGSVFEINDYLRNNWTIVNAWVTREDIYFLIVNNTSPLEEDINFINISQGEELHDVNETSY